MGSEWKEGPKRVVGLGAQRDTYDLTGLNVVTLEGSVGIAPANVNSTIWFEVLGDDKVLWQSGA